MADLILSRHTIGIVEKTHQPFTTFTWDQPAPAACRGGAITFGNFDGVHRGHARLVVTVREQARQLGGPAVAITFDPHPLQLLRPEAFETVMTTPEDRAHLLRAAGADHVLALRTTPDLLQLSPEDFYTRVIHEGLGARAIVEGANFQFGRGRAGTVETLQTLSATHGARCTIVPAVLHNGQPISSSRVRRALMEGNIAEALELLGRPYRITGTVGVGARRGRTLGFPTANLELVATLIPGNGVYAVRVEHLTGTCAGAANIGPNPTFGEQARKLEIHLIDFDGDLYGTRLRVEFLSRLRETRPFAGVEELVRQLQQDVTMAREIAARK